MGKNNHPQAGGEPESFEKNLQRLEAVVAQLERADLTLEDSVRLFEEGMTLVANCRGQLDAAEGKIEILVKKAGGVVPEPFTPRDNHGQ